MEQCINNGPVWEAKSKYSQFFVNVPPLLWNLFSAGEPLASGLELGSIYIYSLPSSFGLLTQAQDFRYQH